MLNYNEIKPKMIIKLDGQPYQVLSANVFRKQKQKPVNQTKLKHLINGNVIERTFQQSESVDEADVETKHIKFLYSKPNRQTGTNEFWFSEPNDPSVRFEVSENIIDEIQNFLKENTIVDALMYDNNIVTITLPIKLTLKVSEAPPNVRGGTASGGSKPATLETGAVVNVPMFIETGDNIEINTESGEYVRRFEK